MNMGIFVIPKLFIIVFAIEQFLASSIGIETHHLVNAFGIPLPSISTSTSTSTSTTCKISGRLKHSPCTTSASAGASISVSTSSSTSNRKGCRITQLCSTNNNNNNQSASPMPGGDTSTSDNSKNNENDNKVLYQFSVEREEESATNSNTSISTPGAGRRMKQIQQMEKFARLPVWPAWNGALLFLLSKVLPNTTVAKLEDKFGGRVCPNFFSTTDIGTGTGNSYNTSPNTSPFIMLVHHCHSFTKFDPLRAFQQKFILPEGFPSHPHRGFITFTYVLRGGMVHRDSIGCKQTYGSERRHGGYVGQWLVTGAGMLHEEMWDVNYDNDNDGNGNGNGICSEQELFQIWVNVPSASKMDRPSVYLVSNEEEEKENANANRSTSDSNSDNIQTGYAVAPTVKTDNGQVVTRVLVGGYNNGSQYYSSNVPLESPMSILHVTMGPNTVWSMVDIPSSFQTLVIYVRRGSVSITSNGGDVTNIDDNDNKNEISTHYTAYLTPQGDELSLTSTDGGDFMLLMGQKINEPVQARGSMVMNSIDGIDQAYNDYAMGYMGR